MKKEIRLVGIDDAPFDKFKKGRVLVVATIFRGGDWIDGILSTKARVDGNDATDKLVEMINKCKFRPQLQCIMLDGIALGGFNVVDIEELNKKTRVPVMVIIRRMPDIENIKKTLIKINQKEKIRLIEKAGQPIKVNGIYIQIKGINPEEAKEILRISCTRSLIPEPIRVAHLIGAGIVRGESKGRA